MLKKVIFVIIILGSIYLLASFFALNGKISYKTSFCSKDLKESKDRELFIEQINTKIPVEHVKQFQFWKEKHYQVTYYGILFSTKELIADKIKLRMEGEEITNLCCDIWVDNKKEEENLPFPYRQLITSIGSKIKYRVRKCKSDSILFIVRK